MTPTSNWQQSSQFLPRVLLNAHPQIPTADQTLLRSVLTRGCPPFLILQGKQRTDKLATLRCPQLLILALPTKHIRLETKVHVVTLSGEIPATYRGTITRVSSFEKGWVMLVLVTDADEEIELAFL